MNDVELLDYAIEFRKGILGGRDSDMMCAMVSWPLAGLLNFMGIKCRTEEIDLGECNHIYIRLADGRVLDPTADQFNSCRAEQMPPVYLGPGINIHNTAPPQG